MIHVPIYASGYPCICNGSFDYSRAYEKAGMPRLIIITLNQLSSTFDTKILLKTQNKIRQ
jgi:hypothetical protein|tara:strand:+ start:684 stop:863 length:180 start_codon:yes stop_codon:yes gene_type:complete